MQTRLELLVLFLRCAHQMSFSLRLAQAPSNSTELHAYNAGVQMGCWGLVIYAATAAVCSGKRLHSQTLERTSSMHCKIKMVSLQLASTPSFGVKNTSEKHFGWS